MTSRRPLLPAIAAVVLAACGGGGGTSPAAGGSAAARSNAAASVAGITARALLEPALAEARAWLPDAELVAVSTSFAAGPRHTFWFYDVQSPSRKSCTRIRVLENGTIENVGTGGACVLMKPLSGDFIDSPEAWRAARAAGFVPGDSVQFALRYQRDAALPATQECWLLWSDAEGDAAAGVIRGWCVDPASGQFVARLAGKGRSTPAQ